MSSAINIDTGFGDLFPLREGREPLEDQMQRLLLGNYSFESVRDAALAADSENGARHHALLFLSHGMATHLHRGVKRQPHLLSEAHSAEEIRPLVEGRLIYISACAIGAGSIPNLIMDAGARGIAAFRGKPSWTSSFGQFLWRDIETCFCRRAVVAGADRDHMEGARGDALALIDRQAELAEGESQVFDVERAKQTVQAAVIR